ncbi:MAG: sugar transferase [Bacteroidetes bacterium]|jgi:lipopolysaccharide/colanic/teichoic acid biosynthesis glycosyltransferase|nr:sugar transferase [Bacteroidota bacterium]MBT5989731.1 sugar transferase [Bacteroidota bacterium]
MTSQKQEKFKILYVGAAREVVHSFSKFPDLFDFSYAENVLLSIDWLKDNQSDNRELHAILSETNLPGMDGFDLHEFIKKDKSLSSIPFILIQHNANDEVKNKVLDLHIDDLYTTPFKPQNLYIRIKFLLDYKSGLTNGVSEEIVSSKYNTPLSKRLFDILFACTALLFLSPFLLIILFLIKIESRGPVFYTSKRVGTGYHIFNFYKLRSMRSDADSKLKDLDHLNIYSSQKKYEVCEKCESLEEPCSPLLYIHGERICENLHMARRESKIKSTFKKLENDPRVTFMGRFIRNTSIDELPQLINVIKGDMSIVGNRPLPLYEAELLTSDQWSERFLGPAGLTGLWQVKLKNTAQDTIENRKKLDNQYAHNHSFWGDIKIIIKTIPAMIQKENN